MKYDNCIYFRENEEILTCPKYGYCIVKAKLIDKCDDFKPKEPIPSCEHLHIVPRRDLSWYCKDCGYDTFKEKEHVLQPFTKKYLGDDDDG